MELVTASLEVGKEVTTEVVKETGKAAESLTEFGKVGNMFETENISFGKLIHNDFKEQISFGSLANGEFKRNDNYLQWKDGIAVGEIKRKWIEELANEISAIFGSDNLKASTKYLDVSENGIHRFNNAGMHYCIGQLDYDPKYLRDNGNLYGEDKILGTIAHEVGHRLVYNLGLADEIDLYENEACADYIAGLTTRLCKLNASHSLAWFNDGSEISLDGAHPGKSVRIEAFIKGFDRIDRGAEASTLRLYEDFSPYDLEKTYQNSDMLRKILYEDVINPLRTGEIKRV